MDQAKMEEMLNQIDQLLEEAYAQGLPRLAGANLLSQLRDIHLLRAFQERIET